MSNLSETGKTSTVIKFSDKSFAVVVVASEKVGFVVHSPIAGSVGLALTREEFTDLIAVMNYYDSTVPKS